MSGPLKLYDVVMHGVATRMKLNEDDAKRYDGTLVADFAPDPEVPAAVEPKPAAKKRAAPTNKARAAAADKDGGTGGDD
ncbi:hypothetical protein [Streptomyces sp. 900116325]